MSSGSSTTGNILGAIGAVVGGIFGGPVGAAQGYAIGSSIGNAIDPPKGPTQEGPRLQDKSVQTSTYGVTIPRVYGGVKVSGNVFWLEKDQLREKVKKESSGGKGGGGGTEVKTYTYYATFAVGICQGPVLGFRRVWVGPNLIYDAGSGDIESVIASNRNANKNISFYYGTEDQLPDSRMQADKGVENTPAYRGLAYIVIKDFELTKYGNSLAQAQVSVEVVSSGYSSKTVLGTVPISNIGFSNQSGAAFSNSFSGINYVSDRTLSSVTESELYLGKYKFVENYNVGFNLDGVLPRGCVSYEGGLFFASQLNDIYSSNVYTRSADLKFFTINSNTYAYGLRARKGYTEDDFIFLYSGGGAGSSGQFLSVGFTRLLAGSGGILFHGMNASSGFRLSTCGSVHEFNISTNTVSVKKYTDLFALESSFSFTSSSSENVFTALPATGLGANSCMIDNDIYICQKVLEGFRIIVGNAYGEIDNYLIQDSIASSEIFAFYMLNQQQGYIATDTGIIQFLRYPEGRVSLDEIVTSETELSNIVKVSDIDASTLTDSVYGFMNASVGSIRNGIEPLRGAWPFDVLQDGYKIKYRARGTASVATIDVGELGLNEQLRESREMDSQIARKVVVKYMDKARDYDTNEQFDQRENTEAVNTLNLNLPVVLTETEAKRVSQKLLFMYWLERSEFSFTLPPAYHYLQPADVITIDSEDASYELRIGRINYAADGTLECSAKPNNAAVYTSIAETDGGLIPNIPVPLEGDSIGLLLDIPVIDETLQNTTGYVGYMTGETSGWPGGVYWITNDDGQTWTDLQGFIGKGTFGTARGTLSANSGLLIQLGGSLVVDLYSGALEGITQSQMLNGKNYAAYGAAGRWEIIRFQNATLNADGSYRLAGFIRGDRGTEWATGLHQSGDLFCLLDDPDGAFIFTNTASIGVPRTLRAVTAGADIDSAANETFTYNGVNLECYSPVHAKGLRDGSGNLAISWIRRTRIGGEWRSNVDASLGEATEAYEIDVMDGATVKRTINSATQSSTYTAAQQTTDFGAPQSSVTVRIYQMSATVGRGYPLEVTL